MACENCFGLITICVTSGFIGIYLLWKYYSERNKFSLYMAVFFLVDCFGWFIWFYTSSLNISEYHQTLINIPVIAAQLVLLLFALSVFKVHVGIRIFSVIVIVGIAIYYIIYPEFLWLVNVTGLVVMILNIILFAMNWQKNEDIKSLGFAVGMIIIALGSLSSYISLFINGMFLVAAAAIWLITFSGMLGKILGENEG